jgi:integrase
VTSDRSPTRDGESALVPITIETALELREAMPLRYRAFVTISAGTGMRRGELLGLTMDRVAFDFAAADQRLEDLDDCPERIWIEAK